MLLLLFREHKRKRETDETGTRNDHDCDDAVEHHGATGPDGNGGQGL